MASSVKKKASSPIGPILAAGAVLWRGHDGEPPSIAIVHRPRYDDWSLPKGKVEPHEIAAVAAVREVHEETGYRCVLGRSLGSVEYALPPRGKRSKKPGPEKRVDYWSAEVRDGEFAANDEVDDIRWLGVDEARELLTYEQDRTVLDRFLQAPHRTRTTVLVRHARAGGKARYRGDDAERPLDSVGVRQAAALVPLLDAFGGTHAFSAERVRCTQTIEPWATANSIDIESEKSLTEEPYALDPEAGRRRAREIAATTPGVPVICSQGQVIPYLMSWWADVDGVSLERTRSRKASVWVLSLHDGVLVAADYTDSPLPRDI